MAAVCSACTFNYYEFMVKFHKENDLSGAFLRVHCALPRFVEYEHRSHAGSPRATIWIVFHHHMNNHTLLGLPLLTKVLYGDVKLY